MNPGERTTSVCPTCGSAFEHLASSPRTFCSKACFYAWRKSRPREERAAPRNPAILKACAICGKAFAALPGKSTCSRQCSAILRARKSMPKLASEAEALLAYIDKHYIW